MGHIISKYLNVRRRGEKRMDISPITSKFNLDGSPRPCIGNTIICPMDKDSQAFKAIVKISNDFKKVKCASKLAFLPESSFHMTVFVLKVFKIPEELTKSSIKETEEFIIKVTIDIALPVFSNPRSSQKPGSVLLVTADDVSYTHTAPESQYG
jgi:hypothetical protein